MRCLLLFLAVVAANDEHCKLSCLVVSFDSLIFFQHTPDEDYNYFDENFYSDDYDDTTSRIEETTMSSIAKQMRSTVDMRQAIIGKINLMCSRLTWINISAGLTVLTLVVLISLAGKVTLCKRNKNDDSFITDSSISESTETFISILQSDR